MKRNRLEILLVEDDENDIFFIQQALAVDPGGHRLNAVRSVEEAMAYLRRQGKFSDGTNFPRPNLILTDLKMGPTGGFDFLRWLRACPEFSALPAVVFSSSPYDRDVREAYLRGASAYMVKPTDLKEVFEMLQTTCNFWSLCEPPPVAEAGGSGA
jgi:CheY-like chemotaxis protein